MENEAGPRIRGRPIRARSGAPHRRHFFCFSIPETSPGDGNLPTDFFEKTVFPSTITSKTPPCPGMSVESAPRSFFSSSAKLAARGL